MNYWYMDALKALSAILKYLEPSVYLTESAGSALPDLSTLSALEHLNINLPPDPRLDPEEEHAREE